MISVNDKDDIEAQIASLKDAVGARNDSQLAEFIGTSRNAVSLWRKRNSIPESARRRVATLVRYGSNSRAMDERRIELGRQVMYEGRCLALFLAPSLDAVATRRIGMGEYTTVLREYSSYFRELELACAEEVAARLATIEGNAADAFASLTRDDPADLLARIHARAHAWRDGEA